MNKKDSGVNTDPGLAALLHEIRQLLEKATPGPWHVGPHYRSDVESREGRVCECTGFQSPRAIANAGLIANAPRLLTACLARLEGIQEDPFARFMEPQSVKSVEEAVALTLEYPVWVLPHYTIGGAGRSLVGSPEELPSAVARALNSSPIAEASVAGFNSKSPVLASSGTSPDES